MRLLMLANVMPYPAHGGVHLRVLNLLQRVARRHEVTLGCHSWSDEEEAEVADRVAWLAQQGIRTVTGQARAANRKHLIPSLRHLFAGQPPELAQYQSTALQALVTQGQFDVLQVEETMLTPYLAWLPAGSAAMTVLTLHNVHFVQEQRIAALEPRAVGRWWRTMNARLMHHYEPSMAARFDRVITVTESDRRLMLGLDPGLTIDVVPNGVDTLALQPLPPPPSARAIVFVGSLAYRPCTDAAVWLVEAILPILRQRIPELELWIVGKAPPPEVLALAGNGVHVTGHVAEVTPYYLRSAVAVVPLRAGGGSRLKILEAMALGRPVVSTTVGAEGIAARDGEEIVLADDAETFAAAVAALLADGNRARAIAAKARRFVEAHHDWDLIADQQMAIYDEMMAS